uniref:RRM domain-containing protein n=1 Tax=Zea mays TaxID=4577 RepID=A0A804UEG9_MAIZE
MQPPHQPPMNGQHSQPPPQGPVVPMPPQQQAPPLPYYQQQQAPQYYQQALPQPWGQQQQYAAPPPQYPPPPQTQHYATPPQQYAPLPQQQYAPPPQQQYAPSPYGTTPGSGEVRTLWIGDLQHWMDENYLHYNAFAAVAQQIASVKIIRNKQTGHSEGYGFIEFYSRAAAEHTLMNFNGQMMPNVEMTFKLNWASASTGDKRGDSGSDRTIFVGDLAHDVTDSMLEDVFRAKYPSVRGANVVVDRMTGWPKGFGFVRFGDLNEQARAMTEMNGMLLSTRQMRIGAAANKKNRDAQQTYATDGAYQSSKGNSSENDPNNTTVMCRGSHPNAEWESGWWAESSAFMGP